MTTDSVCPGDALVALGVQVSPRIVSLLNRWGHAGCSKAIGWVIKHVGSRELVLRALEMSVGCQATKVVRSRGLGDTIAKITTAVGIKPCGGCAQRRALLNKLVPYKE